MNFLSNKSNDELLGYLNNDDGTGLSEAAKQELARRGVLPEWSSEPTNVDANLEAAATPITPDPMIEGPSDRERLYKEQSRVIRAGLHPQQPVEVDTPEQQARWEQFLESNPDEMQRYRPEEYAARQAAERDNETKALYDNIRMKYGDSEAEAWMESRQAGRVYVPRTGAQISASENRRAAELVAARGGDRGPLKAADERYTDAVSRPRWAREAGLSQDAEATTKMSDGDLRLAAAKARAADKQARELQWRAQLMMNRGNYAGALALTGLDDNMRAAISNQQTAMLNAGRPGGPMPFGPNALGVQATKNQQLTDLGLKVAQGQGFRQADPVAQQMMEQKMNEGKPAQVRAQDAVKAGRMNDPAILQHADDMVNQHYSSRPGVMGVSSSFTDNEVMLAAQRLADDTGLPFEEAEKVMRRIQEDRNRNSVASTVIGWMYDQ